MLYKHSAAELHPNPSRSFETDFLTSNGGLSRSLLVFPSAGLSTLSFQLVYRRP